MGAGGAVMGRGWGVWNGDGVGVWWERVWVWVQVWVQDRQDNVRIVVAVVDRA